MSILISRLLRATGICLPLLLLAPQIANAQKDTVEFKFIPEYYPDEEPAYNGLPAPELVYKPEIRFPGDPKLHGRQAAVFVKLSVDKHGKVREVQILKSTDT